MLWSSTLKAVPNLRPFRLSKIDTEELRIAERKLSQYSDELDKMINEPFLNRISWFTYVTIVLVIALMVLYIFCRCRKPLHWISITAGPCNPLPPPHRKWFHIFRRFLPQCRPNILEEDIEDLELWICTPNFLIPIAKPAKFAMHPPIRVKKLLCCH